MAEKRASPEALRRFVNTHGRGYLDDPNITSVGIGHKVVGGKVTDEVSVQFTVAAKLSPEEVERIGSTPIPGTVTVDRAAVATDVVERSFEPSYVVVPEAGSDLRRTRVDPVVPGVSIGGETVSAGTLGCIVYDTDTARPHVLSNWHVLQGPGGQVGDDVLQPGPHDDNRRRGNRLGRLTRSHLGEAGDCAIATIEDRRFDPGVLGLDVAPEEIGEPELGDKVVKSGRTTGVTRGTVSRVDVVVRLDYGEAGEHRIGCYEISPDPAHPPEAGELSDGGDSGSAWLFVARNGRTSKVLAGLHFAGESGGSADEHALACLPSRVFSALDITLSAERAATEAAETATAAGYDAHFLATEIAAPTLDRSVADDAVEVDGGTVLPYTHFSLTMSRSRRLARWVAWNVDGGRLQRIDRSSEDFKLDPRLPEDTQLGEEVYADNDLDRGHLARRADLCWGPRPEAEQANTDSFTFTNICPQMADFNQASRGGVWGQLEDALFEQVEVDDLRISVFAGPVLREDDRSYRDTQLPREYWKVIAWQQSGTLRARGFVLTQDLDGLEDLDLGEFDTWQVPLAEITERTGVVFGENLAGATGGPESLPSEPVSRASDIDW